MFVPSGLKNKAYPQPEVTSAFGCVFLTRHCWKLVKPLSSQQGSLAGSVTATTIKIPPAPCCSDMITLPITQKFPPIQITCMLAIELSLALTPQSSWCYKRYVLFEAVPGTNEGKEESHDPG